MRKLLISIVLFTSCSRVKCEDGYPYLSLDGFSNKDLSLIKIEEYEPGTGFNKLKRSFYSGNKVVNQSADSIPGIGLMMDINSFYRITLIETGTVYNIHDIATKQSYYNHGPLSGEADVCTNAYSYWINSTKINRDLFRDPSNTRPFAIGIYIEKSRVY